jgi:hypothetical protein
MTALSQSIEFWEVPDHAARCRLEKLDAYDALDVELQNVDYVFDVHGNITFKTHVGNYTYGNNAGPHAVTGTSINTVIYEYDANGNQTLSDPASGDSRTIEYTVFDKPYRITKGSKQTTFAYGIGNSRYQRKDYSNAVLQKTTVYLDSVEFIDDGTTTYYKRYIGGIALADYFPSTGVQQTKYLLKDHLGSIHTVLNDSGQIEARRHFSAFGKRQLVGVGPADDWQTTLNLAQAAALNAITTDGFTGHEHADELGIIHMNGRIYDPALGRFWSSGR